MKGFEWHECGDLTNNLRLQVTARTLEQHEELMKKTETMNVLVESNKLLREEKDRLQRELDQTHAKVCLCVHVMQGLMCVM